MYQIYSKVLILLYLDSLLNLDTMLIELKHIAADRKKLGGHLGFSDSSVFLQMCNQLSMVTYITIKHNTITSTLLPTHLITISIFEKILVYRMHYCQPLHIGGVGRGSLENFNCIKLMEFDY